MNTTTVPSPSTPARRRGSTKPRPPLSLPRSPDTHLDAALLAVVHSTKLAQSILPGVPFD
jgi:hypothetical protein